MSGNSSVWNSVHTSTKPQDSHAHEEPSQSGQQVEKHLNSVNGSHLSLSFAKRTIRKRLHSRLQPLMRTFEIPRRHVALALDVDFATRLEAVSAS